MAAPCLLQAHFVPPDPSGRHLSSPTGAFQARPQQAPPRRHLDQPGEPGVNADVSTRIAALAAVMAIGVGSAACSTRPSAAGADLGGSATASTQPCRPVKMKLASVTKQADGATVYHFVAPGDWSNEVVPAAHFDPLKATNTELIKNGFPPRPPGDSAGAVAAWKSAVEAARPRAISVPVIGCTRQ
jgi:hypothetical protein